MALQTFLSEDTYAASARVLDNSRLNKQLLEGRQMLNAMAGNQKGFVNHPATVMWRDYSLAFAAYLTAIRDECINRGIKCDNNWNTILDILDSMPPESSPRLIPDWFMGESKDRIILTHRANLYAKNSEHYAQYQVDYTTYINRLVDDPESVVCCAKHRRVPGMKGLQPCGYYWPSHIKD